ncbi:MocR-like pyridoxine biosynthesis transcription factor PdxR [Microlunatus soli]|uniref:GntR family transcriptional regulator / MocR family aminotransferase n=1 Tax=Microlunatus soli TaxID=630515 RepID=A0A1H2A880_9ACTN|nr:PLP-dependent aminotransferase family protein [Microlunatus soli]SDT42083.1 GntR family transcriptional regulator / MocR family aminotransferase [Microlunatus soli]
MTGGSDFLQLDPAGIPRGRRTDWLADRLRAATGEALPVGARLPATRELAAELGFARGTVTEAYQRLIEEGLLVTNRGGGTSVAARSAPAAEIDATTAAGATGPGRGTGPDSDPDVIDLISGVPDLSAFPRTAWLRAEQAVLERADSRQLGYAPAQGVPELRAELAGWLARSRGVTTSPDRIVITGGVTGALSLLYQVLGSNGGPVVAIEDPGAEGNRRILQHWGCRTVPVPVDADGLDVEALERTDSDAVVLTPAHHYPTGVVLSADRRRRLVSWAADRDALIIEDDYDAEYRYDRAPVRAMQPLAPERIGYASSLSKTLAPALRLGWLAAPERLVGPIVERRWALDLGAPALPQLVLTELLRSGALARHLRSMRTRHRGRRDALVAALTERFPGCRVTGIAAGIYLVVLFDDDVDDQEFARRAADHGVQVQPLSTHRIRPGRPGLVISYANQSPQRLRTAVGRLAAAGRRPTTIGRSDSGSQAARLPERRRQ